MWIRAYDYASLLHLHCVIVQYYQETKVTLAEQKPRGGTTPVYNVMMVGCIQSGKSSTITTVMSAMRNDVGQYAHTGTDDKTVTTKVCYYHQTAFTGVHLKKDSS